MSRTVRLAGGVALVGLALGGCGEVRDNPDFTIRGAGVVVRTDAPFARAPDLPARLETTLEAALDYWGGDWANLHGVTVYLEGSPWVSCGGSSRSVGCWDGDIRVSTLDAGLPVPCVEATALVHEVGHAVVGDHGHLDPRWRDFERVVGRLAGRRGYADGGGAECALVASVWRHPAASP